MLDDLEQWVRRHPRLVALTGAGLSAASGIPTYRDDEGRWQRSDPIQHRDFVTRASSRRRYWARSMAGWGHVQRAEPNGAHHAFAALERLGHVRLLATQNVDRLHQRAGHRRVVDLHGRLDRVKCLDCAATRDRDDFQLELERLNGIFARTVVGIRPDGDAELGDADLEAFVVPTCGACGGTWMPDVVFFGGYVPRDRVGAIRDAIAGADALLVAGSSLMVYSGYRFCRLAAELGKPLLIVNRGRTRADELATLKITRDCDETLTALAARLGAGEAHSTRVRSM